MCTGSPPSITSNMTPTSSSTVADVPQPTFPTVFRSNGWFNPQASSTTTTSCLPSYGTNDTTYPLMMNSFLNGYNMAAAGYFTAANQAMKPVENTEVNNDCNK